jgi:hypothetical protein
LHIDLFAETVPPGFNAAGDSFEVAKLSGCWAVLLHAHAEAIMRVQTSLALAKRQTKRLSDKGFRIPDDKTLGNTSVHVDRGYDWMIVTMPLLHIQA